MSREVHVRFCEGVRGKFPRSTRLVVMCNSMTQAEEALEFVKYILEHELELQLSLTMSPYNIFKYFH